MSVSQAHPLSPKVARRAPSRLKGAILVFALLALIVLALALAVKTWGAVALTMAALPLVPVMFVIFIWISLP
jgi:hypothetical protein